MYVNSPGGSVTAGNNSTVFSFYLFQLKFLYLCVFLSLSLSLVIRHGYIRHYEAYPT